MLDRVVLKDQCHEIFCFGFFQESSSLEPLKSENNIIVISIFSRIRGDIRKQPVSTTPWIFYKFEKALMGFSGALGILIQWKNPEVENLVALSI
jgi:hypothetical protein